MIVSIEPSADAARVQRELAAKGLWVARVERASSGAVHLVVAACSAAADAADVARIPGVASVSTSASESPLVERHGPVAEIAGVRVGGGAPVLFAGPCSVESEAHARDVATKIAALGASFLRGGAFKPRTSPYAFQGHGEPALGWLRRAADAVGLKVVTEALAEADVPVVAEHADLVQIGSRTMHDYALLKAVGKTGRPVLLKRGMAATIEEWLLAGEYLLSSGAASVVFCERGIRGYDPSTRNLLDLGAVALLAHVHRVPVIVDPSHATGRRDLVAPLARAAVAAGAAGVMIETHDNPSRALSDGPQAVSTDELGRIAQELRRWAEPAASRARASTEPLRSGAEITGGAG
jgi:3-deoxy-7-phosphoheptulonate synthase